MTAAPERREIGNGFVLERHPDGREFVLAPHRPARPWQTTPQPKPQETNEP